MEAALLGELDIEGRACGWRQTQAEVIPHKERNLFNTKSSRPLVCHCPHAPPPNPKQTLFLPQPHPNTPKRAASVASTIHPLTASNCSLFLKTELANQTQEAQRLLAEKHTLGGG